MFYKIALFAIILTICDALPHINISLKAKTKFIEGEIEISWEEYKSLYNKKYNEAEDEMRKDLFLKTLKMVNKHNAESHHSYKQSIGKFADFTVEEKQKLLTVGFTKDLTNFNESNKLVFELGVAPHAIDWRDKDGKSYVTPVKNQESCGSCWAFASTGAIESLNAIKTGKLIAFSEQNLLDCSGAGDCNGGTVEDAYDYLKNIHGICTEEEYPYHVNQGTCETACKKESSISDWKYVGIKEEEQLKEAVGTIGPVAIGFYRVYGSFFNDPLGIYSCTGHEFLQGGHGMVIVGYGTENGKDYWIVKNSWGHDWNEEGYVKIARNDPNNHCIVSERPIIPIA